jgi:UDP-N-acetylglucosamine 2-epimerase (non-hydrolysing)
MIDNLFYQVEQLGRRDTTAYSSDAWKSAQLGGRYGVITLHRPSNVDDRARFTQIAGALREVAADLPMLFPMHPRTRKAAESFGIDFGAHITLCGPLSYMEFLHVWRDAQIVLTDSGGMQEETTALGVRCVTMRDSTERPVTIDEGTNVLAGTSAPNIVKASRESLAKPASARRPALWDGKAAERIVAELLAFEHARV